MSFTSKYSTVSVWSLVREFKYGYLGSRLALYQERDFKHAGLIYNDQETIWGIKLNAGTVRAMSGKCH